VAALLCGSPDATLAQRVYREHDWLRVTPTVLSFATGVPVEVAARSPAVAVPGRPPGTLDSVLKQPLWRHAV
jgi:hypothetical protein